MIKPVFKPLMLLVAAAVLTTANIPVTATARTVGESGLPLPRFVSLGVTKANMRVGPKQTHPIQWVYQKKGTPLEIIEEYEAWRRVRDIDGTTGWMHRRLLVGKRTAIITADWASIRTQPDVTAPLTVRAEKGVAGTLEECTQRWCLITIQGRDGWIEKDLIWGVYPIEVFD